MIDRLEIRNFKSIAAADLEFGRVNVFIGVNGSGKSNLLEAIGLYSACLGRGIDSSILGSKGVRLSAPHVLKSSFKNQRIADGISLSGSIGGIEYSASLRPKARSSQLAFASESLVEHGHRVFSRGPGSAGIERVRNEGDGRKPREISEETDTHRSLWDTHGSLLEIGTSSREALRTVSRYVIYAPQTAVMRGISTDSRSVEPLGLTGGRLPQAFREVLEQRYDSDNNDINDIFQIAEHLSVGGAARSGSAEEVRGLAAPVSERWVELGPVNTTSARRR